MKHAFNSKAATTVWKNDGKAHGQAECVYIRVQCSIVLGHVAKIARLRSRAKQNNEVQLIEDVCKRNNLKVTPVGGLRGVASPCEYIHEATCVDRPSNPRCCDSILDDVH